MDSKDISHIYERVVERVVKTIQRELLTRLRLRFTSSRE